MKSFLISVNYACGGHSELDLHFEFDNKQAMTPKLLVSRHTSLYSNRTFYIQARPRLRRIGQFCTFAMSKGLYCGTKQWSIIVKLHRYKCQGALPLPSSSTGPSS